MSDMEWWIEKERPCLLCDGVVIAGEDESKWGLEWQRGWVHFGCAYNIFDAVRRITKKPEIAQLETINADLLETLSNLLEYDSEGAYGTDTWANAIDQAKRAIRRVERLKCTNTKKSEYT